MLFQKYPDTCGRGLSLLSNTSSSVGAATLTPKHRLLIAGMTLLVELQHKMILHVATYFSIVLLKACWASFVSRSTSINTTTKRQDKSFKNVICSSHAEMFINMVHGKMWYHVCASLGTKSWNKILVGKKDSHLFSVFVKSF